ncbi:MAG: Holliday junction resolvase RuvX [Bacteroidetes bacterium]|nr:Holliday junction resolvase RuvX [Bacteroidota bacterium]
MARILAIDYGSKRVGLAVTDPLQLIANALTTVERKLALEFIISYCEKEDVETIVMGYPLNLDGSKTDSTQGVESFIRKLQKQLPKLEIVLEDEQFTSKMAKDAILAGGVKKMKRRDKSMVDKISATLILQSYLESK